MSAPAFDPRAALARIQDEGGGQIGPPPTPPISRISEVSRGTPWQTAFRADPASQDHDVAERAAMAAHYAAEGYARPYLPGDPDPLRDGLYAGALQRPPAF